ncbi:M48 family metalloprotease [Chitinophaga vietnamensis]|uniref:M48 family metalloprotease n=1 Tax=Chitinophaga vietnamensis TaxID=2593957 RepID=UPI001177A567|nr:M48 family metalloprotease [Chitinophaga vietnamensis]
MSIFKLLSAASMLFVSAIAYAQQPGSLYDYQDLSHTRYARQKDSLKKAWTCPSIYKEKETQKKYREIWDNRTDFIVNAIEEDGYVYEREIYNYLDGVISQIARGNSQLLPKKPFLMIDRNSSVNAYASGNGMIAVNIGLMAFVKTREELALVLAHELAHNIMQHPENGMKKKAEWLTSDEYKQSINAVMDSKYERLTRLKKVFEGYSFDRSRHQRYHESDADSLAIVLLRNSHMNIDAAFFLRLDSADIQYRQPLKKNISEYFAAYQLKTEDAWMTKRTKGLSARNYNFVASTTLEDSLKTHPDCQERYNQNKAFQSAASSFTPIPAALQQKAMKMLIWNIYCNGYMTAAMYRILLEKDKGNSDVWYDFMFHNVIAGLYFADKELNRFNAISVKPKEYISKNYYELQTMFEQMPREKLEEYYKTTQQLAFWGNVAGQEKAFKSFLHTLINTPGSDRRSAAKSFITANNTNMYCEYAAQFDKK